MLYYSSVDKPALELLKELSGRKDFSTFSLAGGTSLALQIGHRISYDLDFFSTQPFNPDAISLQLNDFKNKKYFSQSQNILQLFVNDVKLDFVYHPYKLIAPVALQDNLRLFSIEDIAAMKLSAITGRGAKRDFYDLFFLLQLFDFKTITGFYKEKYPDVELTLLYKSLLYFDDADLQSDPILIKEKITWTEVKNRIGKTIQDFLRNQIHP
ncbi:MAG: nucleotidyl transferase AbiEii/AbiGii toxin family protein [Bacteroidetes bacterium]|nr:nucleotidyl transferase AbiEii/AbiGii toxin family protein [Bacteroidota bacterium]